MSRRLRLRIDTRGVIVLCAGLALAGLAAAQDTPLVDSLAPEVPLPLDRMDFAVVESQRPSERLGSVLLGVPVESAINEEEQLGQLVDLVLTTDGRVISAVLELDDGKRVAVPWSAMLIETIGFGQDRFRADTTRAQLGEAPTFEAREKPEG
jgi:hypothetical protein